MRIVPLSEKNLKKAMKLLNKVFPVQNERECSDYWLPASLGNYRNSPRYPSVTWLKYWVAVEKENIIGVTGLYELKEDAEEADWLSWFCVGPSQRGKGVGKKLLAFSIGKAKNRGKKFLRLYTSLNDPNEAAAQKLYEKTGFGILKMNAEKRGKFSISYREKKL